MGKMISKSEDIADVFENLRSEIRCNVTTSKMTPLANSNERLDGKQLIKTTCRR